MFISKQHNCSLVGVMDRLTDKYGRTENIDFEALITKIIDIVGFLSTRSSIKKCRRTELMKGEPL